ncbi:hypothetical protein MKW98_021880 [Papaver atlanticum]|uniref:Uncharacterized protein n=1 Tax=Papaver atlanticum TaxID=357466 RepID=A0AAD4TIP8_9MAGN|nr:hypothetical protein MKW98_021880 [Papaver atlanticum]
MKRHGFGGGPASYGSSLFHRGPGSTGQWDAPGKGSWKISRIFLLIEFLNHAFIRLIRCCSALKPVLVVKFFDGGGDVEDQNSDDNPMVLI